MIRFPDRHHPEFVKLCERLQAFRASMTESRRALYAALLEPLETRKLGHAVEVEHANRAYRRARLRRRRPVKRSVW